MKIKNGEADLTVAGEHCFTRRGLARTLQKSEQTIAGWSTRGFGPPYFLIGKRALYPVKGVLAWLESKLVTPESKRSKNES